MTDREFRWNEFNLGKIAKHGVSRQEAEHIVRFGRSRRHKKGTWIVSGRGNSNRKVQVIYTIDRWENWYIIHAMPVR